jgi:multiple sugar transport system ATP-binding protein
MAAIGIKQAPNHEKNRRNIMAEVTLQHIYKRYAKSEAVRDVNLEIQNGEFIVLVGPSGCGKSTTLRMIAGLEEISAGDLLIDKKRVNDVSPKDRDIAMVFQSYALYPHMNVFDNMAFGLQVRNFAPKEIQTRVDEAAKVLGLETYLTRLPKELSGGQRQRVAMGRAIVRRPKVFLFDEPLSNLDANLRTKMRAEIAQLHKRYQTTTIYVTHDQVEAMTLADRIVVMKSGIVQQVGAPLELFAKPKNKFVAAFLGSPIMNFLPAKVVEQSIEVMGLTIAHPSVAPLSGKNVILGVRPQALLTSPSEGISATLEVIERTGAEAYLHAGLGEHHLIAKVDPTQSFTEKVFLRPDPNAIYLFDPDSEETLLYPNP